jgi:zinc transporter 9
VVVGISANFLVTCAKFVGFFASGSGALLAEAIHSVADTANQSLLLLGLKRSEQGPDASHPYGYGRERFFWGLVSALGIFFLGAGVTCWHGIHSLMHPEPSEHTWITWAVLGFSLFAEGGALAVAMRGLFRESKVAGVAVKTYLREARDPTLLAVLLEDAAAVMGLLLATTGIALEILTGWPGWDALASLTIGVLLAVVALVLIAANRDFLLSKSIEKDVEARLHELFASQESVESVRGLKGVILTVGKYKIAAELDFDGRVLADRLLEQVDIEALRARLHDDAALRDYLREFAEEVVTSLGGEIDAMEAKIRAQEPSIAHIDLEADG